MPPWRSRVVFDPLVEAIRSALRALDANPRSISHYLTLIEAYEACADKEGEPELLEQAGHALRDAKKLPMTDEEEQRLADVEIRVAATLARLRPAGPIS